MPLDDGEVTARLVPGSRLVRLERAGHMFFDRKTWTGIRERLVEHLDGARGRSA